MSDLIVNVRFLFWHFQIKENWSVRLSYNPYHWKHKNLTIKKPFEVYEWRVR